MVICPDGMVSRGNAEKRRGERADRSEDDDHLMALEGGEADLRTGHGGKRAVYGRQLRSVPPRDFQKACLPCSFSSLQLLSFPWSSCRTTSKYSLNLVNAIQSW